MSHDINSTSSQTQSETPAAGQGFTPGPWKYDGPMEHFSPYFIMGGPKHGVLAKAEYITDGFYKTGGCGGVIKLAETLANARLIAAAPDLVEALRLIVTAFDNGEIWSDRDNDNPRNVFSVAHAALARASPSTS